MSLEAFLRGNLIPEIDLVYLFFDAFQYIFCGLYENVNLALAQVGEVPDAENLFLQQSEKWDFRFGIKAETFLRTPTLTNLFQESGEFLGKLIPVVAVFA